MSQIDQEVSPERRRDQIPRRIEQRATEPR